MATLAKKSFHLMNNIRSSNNMKIDSRNNVWKMFARTFNASWLNHSILRGPRMLKQSNLYKELRANVVIQVTMTVGIQRCHNPGWMQSVAR